MSDIKFTKGCWRVQETETSFGRSVLEVVTNTFDVCCYRLGVRNKHDAHLIATAPKIYKMLESLREDYGVDSKVGKDIDALLAESRGEL